MPGSVKPMDDIEKGFLKIAEKIDALQKESKTLSEKIKANDAKLLERMARSAEPVVLEVGLKMLKKGKQDTKGELYHPQYYNEKMIILGKTDAVSGRPDNPAIPVTDQFLVLSEDGSFYELMYSFDGFLTDSYLNRIEARQAIDQYGYDVMFMLYRALADYLKAEEELIAALDKVIGYVFARKS